jgi:thiamine pyrophosphate-dependent acetolactate synthase large subunit-like protein
MSRSRGTVAEAYLALLARSGVDVLFGNGGTDFAPIIEAYGIPPVRAAVMLG